MEVKVKREDGMTAISVEGMDGSSYITNAIQIPDRFFHKVLASLQHFEPSIVTKR